MEGLINSYTQSLLETRNAKDNASEAEKKIFSDMISDLEFTIEWLRTGKRPGNRRGIERRAAYQRERAVDPLLMQRYLRSTGVQLYEWDKHEKENVISEWEKIQLEDALTLLTDREKEVYLMSRGYCFSYDKIANYLVISRSTVQTMIERAEKKVAKRVRESLFLVEKFE